jgi:hypothetical protein
MKINFRDRRIVHEFTESYRKVIENNLQGEELVNEIESCKQRILYFMKGGK